MGNQTFNIWGNEMPTNQSNDISDSCTYIGQFKNSMFHGYGKLILPDGTIYEGHWEMGQKHGNGTLQRPSLKKSTFLNQIREKALNKWEIEIYEGEFQNDLINGKGKLTYPDGTEYKGKFMNE